MIFHSTLYGRCFWHLETGLLPEYQEFSDIPLDTIWKMYLALETGWLSEYQDFSDIPLDTIWKMFVSFRDRLVIRISGF